MIDRADEVNQARQDGTGTSDADDVSALVLSLAGELLERADVALDEDFFSAGGDSVLAMHLVGHLARQTGVRVRVSLLFNHPVLRDFVEQVEQLRADSDASEAAGAAPAGSLAAALNARSAAGAS
ncbi:MULTISPECIES: acyl carrier protein [unclassified Streptomyces]|uniref:acyl carrier protein n=1 Tax=unclassified Streptomyces TaxID=2593676 RepID=UPI002361D376|nr:acyl carrier protein [Streptomyces sp. MMBL 11-1]